jgi:cardiolipin synthase
VKVRIIMPDRLDIYASKKISLECAQKLCGYGIELYAYRPALLHSKTAVIDGVWTTIGSANINGRSFLLNYECNLAVLDRDFAAEVTASLEEDIRNSRRLTQRDLYPANPLQYIVHKLLYLMKDHM